MTESVAAEFALLALFREEVAHHTIVLAEGLAVLKQNPNAIEQLEIMATEVHAIWGGARIVELEPIANLAQVMKDSLQALQLHKTTLSSTQLESLTPIISWLQQLAEIAVTEIVTWVQQHQEEIARLIVMLSGLVTATATEPLTSTETVKQPSNSVTPTTSGASSTELNGFADIMTDPILLGLFLTEVEAHTGILNEGLLALEMNPKATEQLAALMRSAHSIKGAARVVGLEIVIKLAHLLEDCFVAAQQEKLTLVSEHIDILLHSVDMLTTIAQLVKAGHYQQLTQLRQETEALTAALNSILIGEMVLPTPSVSQPLLEEPPSTPQL
jgi:two-component system sensor histidine kinase and response regulator WspE